MPQFVALLRGVNVGKAKRVPMEELRTLLSELNYTSVATLLNSGNAVFHASRGTSAKHAANIAAAISNKLQLEVPVVVKSASELGAIIVGNSIKVEAPDHPRLLVVFTQDTKALSDLLAVAALVVSPEQFVVGENAAYLLCARGILESKAGQALLGKAGQFATTRNFATTLKLQALANECAA